VKARHPRFAALVPEPERRWRDRCQPFERLLLGSPVEEVLGRDQPAPECCRPLRVVLEHDRNPIGVLEWHTAEHNRVHDGEDGGPRADAEGEDDDRHTCECGRLAKRADGGGDVLAHGGVVPDYGTISNGASLRTELPAPRRDRASTVSA
jgi:hypothetical protein